MKGSAQKIKEIALFSRDRIEMDLDATRKRKSYEQLIHTLNEGIRYPRWHEWFPKGNLIMSNGRIMDAVAITIRFPAEEVTSLCPRWRQSRTKEQPRW
jgi:hypothetical protein